MKKKAEGEKILKKNLQTLKKERKQNINTLEQASVGFLKNIRESDIKVRDHRHLTGRYRGAADNFCDLKLEKGQ